ncbi:hypothetical protein PI124_g5821 [Phytophthora idaei]|nr:hypothetical protein PI125_g10676 [Phytophthora idaei]KAG3148684.1 hypothetical protein PI126_g12350 [Phytophthora idaei]KAG3249531.1 hypothetical protein PI124_g5821 [Phytophthora idaei]
MDNYYTSVQLPQELRLKGLYGRGMIRANSNHFPDHTILTKDDNCTRGDFRQAVSRDHIVIAASWYDRSFVNMVSNANALAPTTVVRPIMNEQHEFPAPSCIAEYNHNMQGVDRLDQIRGQSSIADGHAYKHWHIKLALALMDVARSNAYLIHRLARRDPSALDSHRAFITALTGELITGQWMDSPDEWRLFYGRNLPGDSAV